MPVNTELPSTTANTQNVPNEGGTSTSGENLRARINLDFLNSAAQRAREWRQKRERNKVEAQAEKLGFIDRRPLEVQGGEIARSGDPRNKSDEEKVRAFVEERVKSHFPEGVTLASLTPSESELLKHVQEITALATEKQEGGKYVQVEEGAVEIRKTGSGITLVATRTKLPEVEPAEQRSRFPNPFDRHEQKKEEPAPKPNIVTFETVVYTLTSGDESTLTVISGKGKEDTKIGKDFARNSQLRTIAIREIVASQSTNPLVVVAELQPRIDVSNVRDSETGKKVNPEDLPDLPLTPTMVDIRPKNAEAVARDVQISTARAAYWTAKAKGEVPPSSVFVGKERRHIDNVGAFIKIQGVEMPKLPPLPVEKKEEAKISAQEQAYKKMLGKDGESLNLDNQGERMYALLGIEYTGGKEGMATKDPIPDSENPFQKFVGLQRTDVADALAYVFDKAKRKGSRANVIALLESLKKYLPPLSNEKVYIQTLFAFLNSDDQAEYVTEQRKLQREQTLEETRVAEQQRLLAQAVAASQNGK